MNQILMDFLGSWREKSCTINSTESILEWVAHLNNTVEVKISRSLLEEDSFWYYDSARGRITNTKQSFFEIAGIEKLSQNEVTLEQPILIQDEIGVLGILCKRFNGILYFLMQAKIEPGNVNKIQISPTIQATKSNFMQIHGGIKPSYLDYFIRATKHNVIVDQIQSEQSSRFLKKRNRNMIVLVKDEIEVSSTHMWMTLGQIKELMKYDNLVNMDTRTVLSCISFSLMQKQEDMAVISQYFKDKALAFSIFRGNQEEIFPLIFQYINDYKMFNESQIRLIPLEQLKSWHWNEGAFQCDVQEKANFKIIFCDIEIEGREVRKWSQPLLEATGKAFFGLLTMVKDKTRYFLVKACPEVGCFDKIELGPTVQWESIQKEHDDVIDQLFLQKYACSEGILYNVVLSEEGGRFFCEENANVILEISEEELPKLPTGYFWMTYYSLNLFVQFNNCLNIQLRNLLSLLEV